MVKLKELKIQPCFYALFLTFLLSIEWYQFM